MRHGAIPYIPFKTNSKAGDISTYGAKSALWDRMFHFYSLHREEFLTHYHKRSNVETTFHMIKAKFWSETSEQDAHSTSHNLCVVIQSMHELNITPEFSNVAA